MDEDEYVAWLDSLPVMTDAERDEMARQYALDEEAAWLLNEGDEDGDEISRWR